VACQHDELARGHLAQIVARLPCQGGKHPERDPRGLQHSLKPVMATAQDTLLSLRILDLLLEPPDMNSRFHCHANQRHPGWQVTYIVGRVRRTLFEKRQIMGEPQARLGKVGAARTPREGTEQHNLIARAEILGERLC
jgi:hypothetical protein